MRLAAMILIGAMAWAQVRRPAPRPVARPKPAPPVDMTLGVRAPEMNPPRLAGLSARTLPNGLKLALVESNELPMVGGSLIVRAGTRYDTGAKAGLAEAAILTARKGGIEGISGKDVEQRLSALGATVEAGIDYDHAWLSFYCPAAAFDELLPLLYGMAASPSMAIDPFEAVQSEMRGRIASRNQNGEEAVARELRRSIFGNDSPYGRVIEYDNIDAVNRGDAADWARRLYRPGNAILAVHGDFRPAAAEKIFGAWSGDAPPFAQAAEPAVEGSKGVADIRTVDRERAFFAIGQAIRVKPEDRAAVEVLAELLPAYLGTRLRAAGQSRQFWIQGLQVRLRRLTTETSMLEISGASFPGPVTEVVREAFRFLEALPKQELPAAVTEEMKQRANARRAIDLDRPSRLLHRVAASMLDGEPEGSPAALHGAVTRVTSEDLLRVFREHVKVTGLSAAVAVNPTMLDRPLAELNLPLTRVDIAVPAPRTTVRDDEQSRAEGKQWLERMRQAMGGTERLAALKNFSTRVEGVVLAGNRKVPLTSSEQWVANDTIRHDQQLPNRRFIAFYNGKIGWTSDGRALGTLVPAGVRQMRGALFRLLFRLAISDRIEGRVVSHQGGGVVYIADSQENVRLYLDEETGLPRKLVYTGMGPEGSAAPAEEVLSGWREFDGIKMPTKLTVRRGTVVVAEFTTTEAHFNSSLTLAEVEKKP